MIFFISFLLLFFSLSCSSFWTLWISFEVYTLVLSSYLSMSSNIKGVFNYFVVQVVGSSLFLMGALLQELPFLSFFYMYSGLFMKMGAFPFHSWTIALIENLNWKDVAVMFGIPKYIPVWGVFFISFFLNSFWFFFLFLFFCSSTLPLFNLKMSSIRSILGFSAVVHNSWILAASFLNKQVSFFYFTFYIFLLFPLCFLFNFLKMKSVTGLVYMNSLVPVFIFLNFLGIPPLLGFFSKFIVLLEFLKNKMFLEASVFSIIILIPVFFYLKLFCFSLLKSKTSKDFFFPSHPTYSVMITIYLAMLIFMFLI